MLKNTPATWLNRSSMQTTKLQHYVPRTYLANFAKESDLFAYDRWNQKVFPAKPESIAAEKYFYDIEASLDKSSSLFQIFERTLAGVEGKFQPAFKEIVRTEVISDEDQLALAIFIVTQYIRTAKMRDQTSKFGLQVVKALATKHLLAQGFSEEEVEESNIQVKFKPEYEKIVHLKAMFGDAFRRGLAGLLGHIWVLGRNRTHVPLITSDSPVVLFNELEGGLSGFGSPGVQMIFPLSPNYIIWTQELSHSKWFDQLQGKSIELTEEQVREFNDRQIWNSQRFVYYSAELFPSVDDLVKKYAELRKRPEHKLNMIEEETGDIRFRPKTQNSP